MIDLHCHILPGLDDGPSALDESVEMARSAESAGIGTVVATPHVREDYPFDLSEIGARADQVGQAIDDAGISLQIVEGGEVAISKLPQLDTAARRAVCLGEGPFMLVESPYTDVGDLLEESVFELQLQGIRPVLAHPERCPSFLRDIARVEQLVERGILCSVTGASVLGRFGGEVRQFTFELFRRGLVHDVASDAHNDRGRPMTLRTAFGELDDAMPGIGDYANWFTVEAPAAILAGRDLPGAPPVVPARRRVRGLFARRHGGRR